MKKIKKQRSVVPVYLIALFWAIGGFLVRIHRPVQYIVWVVCSVVIFFVGRRIWRDREIVIDVPEPEPEPEPKAASEPEDPEIAALRLERDRAVSEMRRLNANIPDPEISVQIDRIEAVTTRIFSYVMEHPDKKGQIRRFMNYYLPTTIKLLNSYDRLGDAGISSSGINDTQNRITDLMRTAVSAYERQLDALYQGEVMDINAEIKVMENMLNQDGLGNAT